MSWDGLTPEALLGIPVLSASPDTLQRPVHVHQPPLLSTRTPPFTTSYKRIHFSWTLKEVFSHDRFSKVLLEKSALLKST